MTGWEVVIGLEVHAQLATRTKIFCGCPTTFGAPPNTHVCPVCLGMPGSLPVLNEAVVRLAARAALALGATVHTRSQFARKSYFYPDLPKGYQVSQFDLPIATGGAIHLDVDGLPRTVRINRLHLEEDAGKTVHVPGRRVSLVDLNRTGVPLAEIVTEPDLRSVEEASAYLKALHSLLRYTGVSDGNMEEGSFRCDANVSVRRPGTELGTRTETKNLNSFKHVRQALDWEIRRQIGILEDGGQVVQETRSWNPDRGATAPMRSKEEAHDYRYFPDPDLPPLQVQSALIREERDRLPELAPARRRRYREEWGLPAYDAEVLTSERHTADYFEALVALGVPAKEVSNVLMSGALGPPSASEPGPRPSPEDVAQIIELKLGSVIAKNAVPAVIRHVLDTGDTPDEAVAALGLEQVSDVDTIGAAVADIVRAHPGEADSYRAGNKKVFGFLMGQAMRAMGGKGNPQEVRKVLQEALEER